VETGLPVIRNPVKKSLTRPTLLVVDDSPEILRYLRVLLESESYQVETAATGLDAVRRIRSGGIPSVVLLDLQMPGMDGLKTLRSLLRLRPELKVIALGPTIRDIKKRRELLGLKGSLRNPSNTSAFLPHCSVASSIQDHRIAFRSSEPGESYPGAQ
jgi:two-component system, cell cycle sensor histidine kinase and response regulator CckA